ncbi:MAG: hypothetical protein K2N89_07125, partial [Lachnospiraceae bacterium]|nr:hypothetical protein [Lachnospiraceae bacterium]
LHSELDADRIDYLLLDATFSGASYGSFDLGILLQNLAMKKVKIGEIEAWIVGVKEKGIGCADQYMVNRYLAYTQVIFNKYTSVVAKMLREVVYWMMNSRSALNFYCPKDIYAIIDMHEKNEAYFAFTDNYFFEKLNSIIKEHHGCPEDIFYFVEQLRKFRALDMKREDVHSGNLNKQREYIGTSEFYTHLEKFMDQRDFSKGDGLYILSQKKITNHMPYEEFKKNFDAYNETHESKLNFSKYELDRLMDGLAVIGDNGEVMLLIDAPRSILTALYDMQQIMVREYIFPIKSVR